MMGSWGPDITAAAEYERVRSVAALSCLADVGEGVRLTGVLVVQAEGELRVGARTVIESVRSSTQLVATVGSSLFIGADVWIGEGVIISANGTVIIGDGAIIESGARLLDDESRRGIVVGEGACIEEGAVLLAGASISQSARVQRGRVVAGSVPEADEVHATDAMERAAADLSGGNPQRHEDALLAVVREVVAKRVPSAAFVRADASLEAVPGFNSLTAVHLLVELEVRFGILLDPTSFGAANSLVGIERLVASRLDELGMKPVPPARYPAAEAGPRPVTTGWAALRTDLSSVSLKSLIGSFWLGCANLLPNWTMPYTRMLFLRLAGCAVPDGSRCQGRLRLVGPGRAASRLSIGTGTLIGHEVTFGLDARITLGRNVSIGPYCRIYTGTHRIGPHTRRMEPGIVAREVVVEDGVWVGMDALILPGVRLGAGCVVSAGATVTTDVPRDTVVAGNPATIIRALPA